MKESLSAYYDDELVPHTRAEVAEHLVDSDVCAREVEGFRRLCVMAERLTDPQPPAYIWQQPEERLTVARHDRTECQTKLDWLGWTTKPIGRAQLGSVICVSGPFRYHVRDSHPFGPFRRGGVKKCEKDDI